MTVFVELARDRCFHRHVKENFKKDENRVVVVSNPSDKNRTENMTNNWYSLFFYYQSRIKPNGVKQRNSDRARHPPTPLKGGPSRCNSGLKFKPSEIA